MAPLFKKFYKSEDVKDFETQKREGKQGESDFVVLLSTTLQENKEYNEQLREFEERINASGISCEQYVKLGFTFNGLVKPTLILESRKQHEHVERPMLFKRITTRKHSYVIKVFLEADTLPATVEDLDDILYDTILEGGRAQGRAKLIREMREMMSESCKEELKKYEKIKRTYLK